MYAHGCRSVHALLWRSEDNFQVSVAPGINFLDLAASTFTH